MTVRNWAYGFLKRHTRFRKLLVSITERWLRLNPRSEHPPLVFTTSRAWLAQTEGPGRAEKILCGLRPEEVISSPPLDQVQESWRPAFAQFAAAGVPAPHLARLHMGRALGIHGAPATSNGSVLTDLAFGPHQVVSFPKAELIAEAEQGYRRLPIRLEGSGCLLTTTWGRGYFHWLWDVLPRIAILQAAGVELADLDYVIVPAFSASFQVESLRALGIRKNQVVTSFRRRHLQVEELWVPSLIRGTGPVPSWACDFLRGLLQPVEPEAPPQSDRLIITRRATDHGFTENETEVLARARRSGFDTVILEHYSLAEKAWLLSKAEALVGISGAGLANMVFCPPGTAIVEIRSSVEPDPVFWDMAARCGHVYRTVPFVNDSALSAAEFDNILTELFDGD